MKALSSCAGLALAMAAALPARAAAPISVAAANRIADATVAAWTSVNAAKVKALYSPDIVGFDPVSAPLATSQAAWNKLQDGYVAARIDHSKQLQRRVQILSGDVFIVSGVWNVWSGTVPANKWMLRCSDVYERTAGKWPIVNEHCSAAFKS